jgi:HAMP domain-containing protein
MFKNLRLRNKFTLFLSLALLMAVIVSGFTLASILKHNVEQEISSKAELLLTTMISARNYTSKQVNPLLVDQLKTAPEFVRQSVPAYSVREIFEDLRTNSEYQDFFYKEATLNPTNIRDKADFFETDLVNQFRSNSVLKELKGYRNTPGGDLFYIAHPLTVSEPKCMECHSHPQVAPKSLLATYGDANGFGWKLHETVGAQVISVPADTIRIAAQQSFVSVMGIIILAFIATILVTLWLLQKSVIQPLTEIVKTANDVSMGDLSSDFQVQSQDEIGSLATAFSRMKTSLIMAMDMLTQTSDHKL